MNNFRVTFHIDKVGIYYDINEPIHLDSLIEYSYCEENKLEMLEQEDIPQLLPLPLELGEYKGVQVYKASALFYPSLFKSFENLGFQGSENQESENQGFQGLENGITETLHYWRKKARLKNIDVAKGSLNEMQGPYRSYNTPIPVLLIPELIGYFRGDGEKITKLLSKVKGLGKKRSYGYGKVVGFEIVEVAEDYSWIKDGLTMRYLPDPTGTRFVRPRPPYWHHHERINCTDAFAPIS
jgi:CRISPR type IV-associated protein Csf3